jgi:hypothetical protein
MISELEFYKLWDDFDPYSYHEYGNDFCPECVIPSKTCHQCSGVMHTALLETEDSGTIAEYLCDNCGSYHTTEYRKPI